MPYCGPVPARLGELVGGPGGIPVTVSGDVLIDVSGGVYGDAGNDVEKQALELPASR